MTSRWAGTGSGLKPPPPVTAKKSLPLTDTALKEFEPPEHGFGMLGGGGAPRVQRNFRARRVPSAVAKRSGVGSRGSSISTSRRIASSVSGAGGNGVVGGGELETGAGGESGGEGQNKATTPRLFTSGRISAQQKQQQQQLKQLQLQRQFLQQRQHFRRQQQRLLQYATEDKQHSISSASRETAATTVRGAEGGTGLDGGGFRSPRRVLGGISRAKNEETAGREAGPAVPTVAETAAARAAPPAAPPSSSETPYTTLRTLISNTLAEIDNPPPAPAMVTLPIPAAKATAENARERANAKATATAAAASSDRSNGGGSGSTHACTCGGHHNLDPSRGEQHSAWHVAAAVAATAAAVEGGGFKGARGRTSPRVVGGNDGNALSSSASSSSAIAASRSQASTSYSTAASTGLDAGASTENGGAKRHGGSQGGSAGGLLPTAKKCFGSTSVSASAVSFSSAAVSISCREGRGALGKGGVGVGRAAGRGFSRGLRESRSTQGQQQQQKQKQQQQQQQQQQQKQQQQQQALPLSPPPMAPLSRERFKAEATELEAALRSRESGSNGARMDEGDASGHQLASARRLRSLLSSNTDELIQEALDREWVPLLMGWLGTDTRPAVQVEALWALTNIAHGATDHAQVLTNSGAVPPLVLLLDSTSEEVLEQALWLLGNLAGEGTAARDAVLAVDPLPPLVRCLERHEGSGSLLKIGSWTLSNLCEGQPRPVLEIHTVIPALAKLLQHTESEILSHTCWALSHLCDGPSTHIRAVVDADICWRLVELLEHQGWGVTKPALRTIGNIVCAEDDTDYTQHIIEAGAVPCLQQLIAHSNREIQKEACWTLSNIAAGTVEQIQTVLDSGALPSLVQLASSQPADPSDPDSGGADPEVRSEASWAVLNATSCGSDQQIEYLVKEGGIEVLAGLLNQSTMVAMALEGLERILQVGDKEAHRLVMMREPPPAGEYLGVGLAEAAKRPRGNPYAALLQATKIELLESHKTPTVAKRAQRIRKSYFVRCAICKQSSSKDSLRTRFCLECKCDVCKDCDCHRFHLDFQEELWKEMSEQEANAKANKKSKKQKKKQKAKERSKASTTCISAASTPTAAAAAATVLLAGVDTHTSEKSDVGEDVADAVDGADSDHDADADKASRASALASVAEALRVTSGTEAATLGAASEAVRPVRPVKAVKEPVKAATTATVKAARTVKAVKESVTPVKKEPVRVKGSGRPVVGEALKANAENVFALGVSDRRERQQQTRQQTRQRSGSRDNSTINGSSGSGANRSRGVNSGVAKGKGQRRARAVAGAAGARNAATSAFPFSAAPGSALGKKESVNSTTEMKATGLRNGDTIYSSRSSNGRRRGKSETDVRRSGAGADADAAGITSVLSAASATAAAADSAPWNSAVGVGRGRKRSGSAGGSTSGSSSSNGVSDDDLRQNDNYVTFLNQTGSILALAQMLDKQSLEDS